MPLFRFIRRRILQRKAFPESWLNLLKSRVPYYKYLPPPLKDEFHKHLPVIMDEKNFEGCGGLTMTEEKKIIIAAYATILILGEPTGYYPDLQAILVYPDDYMAPVNEEDASGIMTEGVEMRSGESWDLGTIVLSWRDIENDIQHPLNGRNLIIHEFSHQIDQRYGMTAGIDEAGNVHTSNEWNDLLADEYRSHRRAVETGRPTLIDPYGATHPAEFFSVATELFFENAHRMKRQLPKLYEMFKRFYKIDPASFLPYR